MEYIPPLNTNCPFKVGDFVAARFVIGPRDGLAEYAVVHQDVCDKIPSSVLKSSPSFMNDASALAGANPSVLLADRIIERSKEGGKRILILGGSGGLGTHVCQLLRQYQVKNETKPFYICGVGSNEHFLEHQKKMEQEEGIYPLLSYDKVIDHTQQNVFEFDEYVENKFDFILDFASGGWLSLLKSCDKKNKSIIKANIKGGHYFTTTTDEAIFKGHSVVKDLLPLFLWIPLWRYLKSRTLSRKSLPKYTFAMSLPMSDRSVMTRMLKAATSEKSNDNNIKAVIDPRGPFPFTEEGVKKAFKLQQSRHAFGKVVIEVAKLDKK